MAEKKLSKTARRSSPSAAGGGFQADGDAPRITSLGAGSWAYVRNSEGKLLRLRVGSDELNDALRAAMAASSKVGAEVEALAQRWPSWKAVQEALQETDTAE